MGLLTHPHGADDTRQHAAHTLNRLAAQSAAGGGGGLYDELFHGGALDHLVQLLHSPLPGGGKAEAAQLVSVWISGQEGGGLACG